MTACHRCTPFVYERNYIAAGAAAVAAAAATAAVAAAAAGAAAAATRRTHSHRNVLTDTPLYRR